MSTPISRDYQQGTFPPRPGSSNLSRDYQGSPARDRNFPYSTPSLSTTSFFTAGGWQLNWWQNAEGTGPTPPVLLNNSQYITATFEATVGVQDCVAVPSPAMPLYPIIPPHYLSGVSNSVQAEVPTFDPSYPYAQGNFFNGPLTYKTCDGFLILPGTWNLSIYSGQMGTYGTISVYAVPGFSFSGGVLLGSWTAVGGSISSGLAASFDSVANFGKNIWWSIYWEIAAGPSYAINNTQPDGYLRPQWYVDGTDVEPQSGAVDIVGNIV